MAGLTSSRHVAKAPRTSPLAAAVPVPEEAEAGPSGMAGGGTGRGTTPAKKGKAGKKQRRRKADRTARKDLHRVTTSSASAT